MRVDVSDSGGLDSDDFCEDLGEDFKDVGFVDDGVDPTSSGRRSSDVGDDISRTLFRILFTNSWTDANMMS